MEGDGGAPPVLRMRKRGVSLSPFKPYCGPDEPLYIRILNILACLSLTIGIVGLMLMRNNTLVPQTLAILILPVVIWELIRNISAVVLFHLKSRHN